MTPTIQTPRNLGYRMPAEWEPHEGTWLSWPHNEETWPSDSMGRIQDLFARMTREISRGEKVYINVLDPEMEKKARVRLQDHAVNLDRVSLHHFPTNDSWARDHGPIFIIRKEKGENQPALTDWDYNAWGGKYPPFDQDNAIPRRIAELLDIPRFEPQMILEGGSIEVNGSGCLLTSEACLLNPNRNPGLNKNQIEQHLKDFLGVEKILWLGDGILGDDTDGHVDDITRFVASDTLITVLEGDAQDPNYNPLAENFERLKKMRDPQGKPFEVLSLPMPKPLLWKGEHLPASYANFYIANEVVLVPVFEDPQDEKALSILQKCFPERKVIGLDCRELLIGLGGIHCVTQQQPKAR